VGIDYPMGRSCPRCPFWAGIDRFTHEPKAVPAPTLSPSEILTILSRDASAQPEEALVTQDGARILAAVCDGDLPMAKDSPIRNPWRLRSWMTSNQRRPDE
jgi:hypothetical protein